ncbi:hypothetical protein HNR26_001356 [Rhizobium rosettiformans]|jgi:hypothetical protein|uniref:Uncharacterized protein n=2 Tax=Rhizobium rosettiformans TaxID=1368430 RepID=A0A4S8QEA6_9HYPH|nr:hypothetical protein [Rhizobium rosettiformans]MBB5275312.1 hypothetical protein [Rhizobium rosettiformans]THV38884.1 hypothetical protein FAA86_00480 [Rhizobium rosettiformans W3]
MIIATRSDQDMRRTRDRQSERQNMRRLYLLLYPLCLFAAVTSRLSGHAEDAGQRPEQSVFAEARSAAYAAAGYAFHA